MKNKPIITGIIAIVSPLPMVFFTMFWGLCIIAIGISSFNYHTVPQWMLILSLFPLLISPAIGLWGVIHGIIKIKKPNAAWGIILSVIGLLENFLLIYGMYFLGSRF